MDTIESKADRYFRTLYDPCLFCGLTRHKHKRECQLWSSIAPERCILQHTMFLRGSNPKRTPRYEYECNLCNLASIFVDDEIKQPAHPLCGVNCHHWVTCGDSCAFCGVWCCGCGKKGYWDDLKGQHLREEKFTWRP